MAITFGDNISYKGKKPLDERFLFKTLEDMKNYKENYLPALAFCQNEEDGKLYVYSSKNDIDEKIGRWREFSDGKTVVEGDGISISKDNEISVKVDNETIKVDEDGNLKVTATAVDSYLSRAKETNPNADFEENTSFVFGTNNLNGGFQIEKEFKYEFSTYRTSTICTKYNIEIINSPENFEKIRNTIIERFDEFRQEPSIGDNFEGSDVFDKNNGWYFDINDISYVDGSRSHPYIGILINFKLQKLFGSKNSALIGEGLETTKDGGVIFGSYNKTTDAALVIGNGTEDLQRSDSLVITNNGEIKAHEYYKDDVLFQSDFAETDENKSTAIINKPSFNHGLTYKSEHDKYTVHYFDEDHNPVSFIASSGYIQIELTETKNNYNSIIFTGKNEDGPNTFDLLKTEPNTRIYHVSGGQYGSSNITFKGFLDDDKTFELYRSPTIGGAFDYTINANLHEVNVNVDNKTIKINEKNLLEVITSGSDGIAPKEWVNDGTENGSLPMQAISGAYNSYDDMTAEGAKEDALVTNAGIQDYVDTILQDGDGVKLESVVDDAGHPTIKFNTNIQITGKNGSADDALTFTALSAVSEGQSQFDITIPDATSAAAGVTKAAYYSDPEKGGDGLIYLF